MIVYDSNGQPYDADLVDGSEYRRLAAFEANVKNLAALSDSGLRLLCGELTAQEIRTIRAVLNAIIT